MAERTRPIRIEFCVTEQERRLIQSKMTQLGTKNMGAYLRKMAIDGYIMKVDDTQQMENSINQVPIHLKMTFTAKEAAEYSNIGINKIDSMLRSPNCPFVLFVGSKKLVKRKEFEQYISQALGGEALRKRAPCAILYSVVVCSFLLCGKGARPWEKISREKTAVRVSIKERTDCIAHDLLIRPGSGMRNIFRRCLKRGKYIQYSRPFITFV